MSILWINLKYIFQWFQNRERRGSMESEPAAMDILLCSYFGYFHFGKLHCTLDYLRWGVICSSMKGTMMMENLWNTVESFSKSMLQLTKMYKLYFESIIYSTLTVVTTQTYYLHYLHNECKNIEREFFIFWHFFG